MGRHSWAPVVLGVVVGAVLIGVFANVEGALTLDVLFAGLLALLLGGIASRDTSELDSMWHTISGKIVVVGFAGMAAGHLLLAVLNESLLSGLLAFELALMAASPVVAARFQRTRPDGRRHDPAAR